MFECSHRCVSFVEPNSCIANHLLLRRHSASCLPELPTGHIPSRPLLHLLLHLILAEPHARPTRLLLHLLGPRRYPTPTPTSHAHHRPCIILANYGLLLHRSLTHVHLLLHALLRPHHPLRSTRRGLQANSLVSLLHRTRLLLLLPARQLLVDKLLHLGSAVLLHLLLHLWPSAKLLLHLRPSAMVLLLRPNTGLLLRRPSTRLLLRWPSTLKLLLLHLWPGARLQFHLLLLLGSALYELH